MRHAAAAPSLALAVNVGAFNLANAIGAALGGVAVATGMMRWGGFAGAGFAVLGLILSAVAVRIPTQTARAKNSITRGTAEARS
jgi:DHA1 family inner membrane transport protein